MEAMTRDEAMAALDEIRDKTGYAADLTTEITDFYWPLKLKKNPNKVFYRVTYIIYPRKYRQDAATPGDAIAAALDHVRKETKL
jgi:hypothetical protein